MQKDDTTPTAETSDWSVNTEEKPTAIDSIGRQFDPEKYLTNQTGIILVDQSGKFIPRLTLNHFLEEWIGIMSHVVRKQGELKLEPHQISGGPLVKSIDEFHRCNSPAYATDFLGVSRFWATVGGEVGDVTTAFEIHRNGLVGVNAILSLLDCTPEQEQADQYRSDLTALVMGCETVFGFSEITNTTERNESVTAEQFLNALARYRHTGSPEIEGSTWDAV